MKMNSFNSNTPKSELQLLWTRKLTRTRGLISFEPLEIESELESSQPLVSSLNGRYLRNNFYSSIMADYEFTGRATDLSHIIYIK